MTKINNQSVEPSRLLPFSQILDLAEKAQQERECQKRKQFIKEAFSNTDTRTQCDKTIFQVTDGNVNQASVCPGKSLKSPVSYLGERPVPSLSDAPFYCGLLTLPANIRPGLKDEEKT